MLASESVLNQFTDSSQKLFQRQLSKNKVLVDCPNPHVPNLCNNNELDSSVTKLIPSHPDKRFEGFLRKCVDIIINKAVFESTNRSAKVVNWQEPENLKKLFDFRLKSEGEDHSQLISLLEKTIEYSVKTGHPYFINQLYSGLDPYALIGEFYINTFLSVSKNLFFE